jgi:glycosyltransferase involved in cell wall biosynthesis
VHGQGYRLLETPIVRPGDFHLHFYPRLGALLDALRPELVHVDEEPYNLATFLAMRHARRLRARTVFFSWQNLKRRYPPPFSLFERSVYGRADGAIAGSRTAAEVLRAKGYGGPLWVLPQFGADPEVFRPAPEPHGDGPLVVGYAGRLVPAKGVDLLIEALAGLEAPWRLHILGEGPERPALEALARRRGLADRVSFTGWRPSSELPVFFRGLDVLALPSRSTPSWIEQFGRVLIEAMACGVACVGSDSGEIPHVLGSAGLVVPEGDVAALRGALARLAGDPELRTRLGVEGRARVLEQFTMAHVARETAAIYRAVRAGAGGSQ